MELSNLAPLADDIALIGMRWQKRNQKEKQQTKVGSIMNASFIKGFEKIALRPTRLGEVAANRIVHDNAYDKKGNLK